ncbi:phosphate ABC transporter, permease protein PstA [Notoacmeibacter marinus]|uniref:Phosphate transport system permease protein PstA n=1 Tax=Notoacmeibacter marinus TaxID=1876515 RepID=A0A231UXA7_9HYPH|nr:phosphate ABC transporter permease PstA [Notoacmeibacter marinus]OXT00451.1 phosphate ABC transporter, permease protein PstA [Notoacmeibacter marinus]
MSDTTVPLESQTGHRSLLLPDEKLKKRRRSETWFKMLGLGAVITGLFFLVILIASIVYNGVPAFTQTYLTIPVTLPAEKLDKVGNRNPSDMRKVSTFGYKPLLEQALIDTLADRGIEMPFDDAGILADLLSDGAAAGVRRQVLDNPDLVGQTVEFDLLASSRIDGYYKGRVDRASVNRGMVLTSVHLDVADALKEEGLVERRFNLDFIIGADASDNRPEQAGVGVALLGSLFMILVVVALAVPIGVAAAIYLEEFAPQNRFTDLIEVNISNLAAVPSIVFGILGLAAFIQFANLPQSAPLVGGLVLTLMSLPQIIIPARAALKAVPPSIRQAALGIGASRNQMVFQHVLPLAMPGILTGVIISLAQALGETAPLLLIGMVGYIASNYPDGFLDGFVSPNSALPAQIYEWSKRADPAFYERAWGGIIVLLVFMLAVNILAVVLRRRFERRW